VYLLDERSEQARQAQAADARVRRLWRRRRGSAAQQRAGRPRTPAV